jgi:hypothetical protein
LPTIRNMIASGEIRQAHSLQELAEHAVLSRLAGKDLATREVIMQALAQVKADLAGSNPTPLERLLVDRVGLCWLEVQVLDILFSTEAGLSIRQAEHQGRARERANARFLKSARALAVVRKIGLPALQINVGNHNTNISAGG